MAFHPVNQKFSSTLSEICGSPMFSLWFPYVALCFPYGLDVLLSKMLKEKRKEVPMQGGPQRSPRGNVVA